MSKLLSELTDTEVRAGAFAEEFDADSRAIYEKIKAEIGSPDKSGTRAAIEEARRARSANAVRKL